MTTPSTMRRARLLDLQYLLFLVAVGLLVGWVAAEWFFTKGDRARQTYSREAFQQLVVGKPKEQLVKILGRPDQSGKLPDQWWYEGITLDPVNQRVDRLTIIRFTDGTATAVEFGRGGDGSGN